MKEKQIDIEAMQKEMDIYTDAHPNITPQWVMDMESIVAKYSGEEKSHLTKNPIAACLSVMMINSFSTPDKAFKLCVNCKETTSFEMVKSKQYGGMDGEMRYEVYKVLDFIFQDTMVALAGYILNKDEKDANNKDKCN